MSLCHPDVVDLGPVVPARIHQPDELTRVLPHLRFVLLSSKTDHQFICKRWELIGQQSFLIRRVDSAPLIDLDLIKVGHFVFFVQRQRLCHMSVQQLLDFFFGSGSNFFVEQRLDDPQVCIDESGRHVVVRGFLGCICGGG